MLYFQGYKKIMLIQNTVKVHRYRADLAIDVIELLSQFFTKILSYKS
jgi:hypothetical protein